MLVTVAKWNLPAQVQVVTVGLLLESKAREDYGSRDV